MQSGVGQRQTRQQRETMIFQSNVFLERCTEKWQKLFWSSFVSYVCERDVCPLTNKVQIHIQTHGQTKLEPIIYHTYTHTHTHTHARGLAKTRRWNDSDDRTRFWTSFISVKARLHLSRMGNIGDWGTISVN